MLRSRLGTGTTSSVHHMTVTCRTTVVHVLQSKEAAQVACRPGPGSIRGPDRTKVTKVKMGVILIVVAQDGNG